MTTEIPEVSAEPEGFKKGDTMPGGVGTMEVTDMVDNQWFWVYSTKDGSPSRLNINMRQYIDPHDSRVWRHEDGQVAFTRDKPPHVEEVIGMKVRCLLHKDNPIRPHLNTIGLTGRYCSKRGYLASDFDLRRHMMRTHSGEFQIIQDNKASIERAETMAMQKQTNEAMQAQVTASQAIAEMVGRNNSNDNAQDGEPDADRSGDNEDNGPPRRGPGRPKQLS